MKKKNKTCVACGIEFMGYGNTQFCPTCRAAEKAKQKLHNPHPERKTISQIIREVERYNREHGTCLTYGQYVSKFENKKGGRH